MELKNIGLQKIGHRNGDIIAKGFIHFVCGIEFIIDKTVKTTSHLSPTSGRSSSFLVGCGSWKETFYLILLELEKVCSLLNV